MKNEIIESLKKDLLNLRVLILEMKLKIKELEDTLNE